MKLRPTPALVVAVLALVVALGGTSYAAAKIGSAQIKNNSVKGKDVKDGSLTGKDVKDGSLTGADVADGSLSPADLAARTCAASDVLVLGSCIDKAATGPSSFAAALTDCNAKGGRLMSWPEYRVLRDQAGITWANGNLSQYEFIDLQTVNGAIVYPSAVDFGGALVGDASAQIFWHRCVTPL
ncbi:hypothetical protein G5V58_13075 [Nocardioides anomalus]|uniref:Uncharacterized protein n=1 Tax=Nocardioides anomalus TaxID=2712223 RepID=A0A6G6WEI5_9ACTN|nr:hypothetical protein [Nocardioides anomalus]QIG43567.1 hypothetical protein G5V58_13075 [Nocardioides anomalus]